MIDELAEVDSGLFWHHINSRWKKSLITPGSHIKFDGRDVYSEREITDEWGRAIFQISTNHQKTLCLMNLLKEQ